MILEVNKTSPSLSQNSSEGYIAYKDLGPRPLCGGCDEIEECPVCASDTPYKIPVVPGDLIYTQYSQTDLVNTDPTNPTVGWFSENEGDYYIKGTIEFSSDAVEDIILTESETDIIASQNVDYNGGSFQNLILRSSYIQQYIVNEGVTNACFRFKIETFQKTYVFDYTIVGIFEAVPDHISVLWNDGDYIIVDSSLYQLVNGEFVFSSFLANGTVVYNTAKGSFFIFDFEEGGWVAYEPEFTLTVATTCTTTWYKFLQDCQPSVLIEGVHGDKDCKGRYYGLPEDAPDGTLAFRDQYRIEGFLEPNGIRYDEEVNENDVIESFKTWEKWRLTNTAKAPLPWKIVQKIGNSVKPAFYLNGNRYQNIGDIDKTNEAGDYWFISIACERLACDKENDCDAQFLIPDTLECAACDTACQSVTVLRDGIFYALVPAGGEVDVSCGGAPSGDNVVVSNSDDSYTETVPCGDELELPDQTINFYLDGVLQDTETYPAMTNPTFDIVY